MVQAAAGTRPWAQPRGSQLSSGSAPLPVPSSDPCPGHGFAPRIEARQGQDAPQLAGGAAWFMRAGRAAAGCAGAVLLKNGGSVPPLKGLWVRLREKGGKRHAMPCHHNREEYLTAYRLRDDPNALRGR